MLRIADDTAATLLLLRADGDADRDRVADAVAARQSAWRCAVVGALLLAVVAGAAAAAAVVAPPPLDADGPASGLLLLAPHHRHRPWLLAAPRRCAWARDFCVEVDLFCTAAPPPPEGGA